MVKNKSKRIRTEDKEVFGLVTTLINMEKYALALNYLKELLIYNPDNYYVIFNLAKIYLQLESQEQSGKDMLIDLLKTKYKPHALIELTNVEIKNGETDKARKYLNQLLHTEYNAIAQLQLAKLSFLKRDFKSAKAQLNQLLKKDNFIKILALESLIDIEMRQENYNDALRIYYDLIKLQRHLQVDYLEELNVENILNYKLDLPHNHSYLIQQLEEYDELKALGHIYKHLENDDNKRVHNVFNNNINIDDLYYQVKAKITSMNSYEISVIDKYFVKTDEDVGEIFGIKTNKVKVITIPNTKKILTMYPANYMRQV